MRLHPCVRNSAKFDVIRSFIAGWYHRKRRALGRFVGAAVAVPQMPVLRQGTFAARAAAGHWSLHVEKA